MAERKPQADIAEIFTDRWSPRAFSSEPITESQLESLFEAARWAPSCYNEQPWEFYYVTSNSMKHTEFVQTLVEINQSWACNAPALVYLVSRNNFAYNDKANPWSDFDAGSAWMSLALQARQMGLYAHAMAGFSRKAAMEFLRLDEEKHKICAAIAIGCLGDKKKLSEELQKKEEPSERISAKKFAHKIV